jgi:Family of unknown function (DUF6361)
MLPALSWLDFAESDRQRAMQVIDLFTDRNTVDELGFSPVRDAYADRFFPGTSTIQTRARYFLFVPWIFRSLDSKGDSVDELSRLLRKRESGLIDALLKRCPEADGIIGREAKSRLQRMPSSVYWRGLRVWNIRGFDGSIEQHFRRLARGAKRRLEVDRSDDGEPLQSVGLDWPGLPPEPAGFRDAASLDLTLEEAEFLRDRISHAMPFSALARLVTSKRKSIDADFVWDAALASVFSGELRAEFEHARLFALCAWGATNCYGLQVARRKGSDAQLESALLAGLADWSRVMQAEEAALSGWDRAPLWRLVEQHAARQLHRTRKFAEEWIAVALRAARGAAVWDDPAVHARIVERELQLKGSRARLAPESQRGRDLWQGRVATAPMDYRWGQTKVIVNDILRGLHGAPQGGATHA